jgi:N-acetylneuraminic acid mutarotase
MASTRRVATWLIGFATLSTACADALRLEPPQGGSGGGTSDATTSTSTSSGDGGNGPINCKSNADCPEPTSVCDTVSNVCVECLTLSDCAFRPSTVCSEGQCVCPDKLSYCSPGECVDMTSSPKHCGQCNHACFGVCAAGNCVDAWEPVGSIGAPSARSNHVAVWTGGTMVVWGGLSNGPGNGAVATGGIYDPMTYKWTATSSVGAPKARYDATAIWTGTEMVVWGGTDGQGTPLNDGGRFDPVKNTWTPIASNGAPTARTKHTAVWTGTEMIVWGGSSNAGPLPTGGRFSPITNSWSLINTNPNPVTTRTRHCAVWDKNKALMNIVGGFGSNVTDGINDVYFPAGSARALIQYAPVGENWYNLGEPFEPSKRADHTCVFDGLRLIVFGGFDGSSYLNTGATWDPTGGWTTIAGSPPDARSEHTATWIDAKKIMVVFGGRNPQPLDSGALFDSTSNSWTLPMPTVLSARYGHTAVSTGDKLMVWGGNGFSGKLADGGIYKP